MEAATTTARPRRERPKPVKLSDSAATRIREIMEGSDGAYEGVRVGVTNGGCAGMSYTMDYADKAAPYDEVIEDKGVKIFIDPKAIMFLLGTEMTAEDVEEPFGRDGDDLDLGRYCETIRKTAEEVLGIDLDLGELTVSPAGRKNSTSAISR